MLMIYRHRYLLFSASLALLIYCAAGCTTAPCPEGNNRIAAQKKSRLLVLPFTDMTSIFGMDVSVRGPATGQALVTGQVAVDSVQFLDTALHRKLAMQPGLLWNATTAGADLLTSVEITNRQAHIHAIRDIGSARNADAVLGGYVYTFQERQGGEYGAENPAKVTFELVLIHVDSGRLLWHRRYDEQQKPLLENLMAIGKFFKRKGRWVSALEMAEMAIDEMLPEMLNALPD
jgi:hypothetical protein